MISVKSKFFKIFEMVKFLKVKKCSHLKIRPLMIMMMQDDLASFRQITFPQTNYDISKL